jgi:RNA polymerase sigma factor (sigma-70 family)
VSARPASPESPEAHGYGELLRLLAEEPRRAEREYRRLRERLIQLFQWRRCTFPEDLADETLSRVAHKVGEGLEIRAKDPFRYCCGVAFRVFQERLRERARRRRGATELREAAEHVSAPDVEKADEAHDTRRCLGHCLEGLGAKGRSLILRYYEGETRARIENRKRMAADLGIPPGALRSRARRLRSKLETCLTTCLKQEAAAA